MSLIYECILTFSVFFSLLDFSIMSAFSLQSILDANKLVGKNFDVWYHNLRIVLVHQKLIDVIDKPMMKIPLEDDANAWDAYLKYDERCISTKCIILASMSSELQKHYMDMSPSEIIERLKKIYDNTYMKNVFMISLATIDSTRWVLDTGSSFNICNTLQGLRINRRLKKGEINLQVGNGASVAALLVGSISLILPTGKTLLLEDCYYFPKFVSNIISISSLDKSVFHTIF
jgi:hypothetical protein